MSFLEKINNTILTALAAISGVTGTVAVATDKLYKRMTSEVFKYDYPVTKPAGSVQIVMPAYNEEYFIEQALDSLLNQNIIHKYPDYFGLIVVDNGSEDATAEIASLYAEVIKEPRRGKLYARDTGIKYSQADIIVAVDADCLYPPNWLNLVLRHFHNSQVVAVSCPHIPYDDSSLVTAFYIWYSNIIPHARARLPGGGSAFRRQAYFDVGGFNLDIDQTDRVQVLIEEEVNFPRKLTQLGDIVYELKAPFFISTRGYYCSYTTSEPRVVPEPKYCKEIRRGERF